MSLNKINYLDSPPKLLENPDRAEKSKKMRRPPERRGIQSPSTLREQDKTHVGIAQVTGYTRPYVSTTLSRLAVQVCVLTIELRAETLQFPSTDCFCQHIDESRESL